MTADEKNSGILSEENTPEAPAEEVPVEEAQVEENPNGIISGISGDTAQKGGEDAGNAYEASDENGENDEDGENGENDADDFDEETYVARRTRRKKIIAKITAIVVAVVFLVQCIISVLLYNFALTPGGFGKVMKRPEASDGNNKPNSDEAWVEDNSTDRYLTSSDGLKLHAYYIADQTVSHSYAVLCHPYSADGTMMGEYARHYYSLGFRILLPDARGHGKSEGKYIGMGWDDRLDIAAWIDEIVSEDPEARILLHGVSMGGATVAMVSGEDLPENVRVIVDDCGYSSVWDEFSYQMGEMFSLPSFPILNMASLYTEIKAGWGFKEASAVEQVKKSKTPTLFIHGEEDSFVPTKQGNALYDACAAEKEQLIIEGAGHAQSLFKNKTAYWAAVDRFMLNHFGL